MSWRPVSPAQKETMAMGCDGEGTNPRATITSLLAFHEQWRANSQAIRKIGVAKAIQTFGFRVFFKFSPNRWS